ncbi:MAG: hypothetical protein R2911_24075 [Caldilineaceae bacterium]
MQAALVLISLIGCSCRESAPLLGCSAPNKQPEDLPGAHKAERP